MDAHADRLIAVFSQARTMPAGWEREQAILEFCADDLQLQEEVTVLLAAHDSAGDFLNAPPFDLAAGVVTEKAGDRIGRYKLLEEIGEGGCGVVYLAEQEVPVRRRVALKVIKLGMDTREVVARFEAERQALALMEDASIAKVFDAGATSAGRPFFVMELVRGIRITDHCDQHQLSTPERLELFIQVCGAIQHAHQKGIIHRDIKPSNVLVADGEPGSPGVPKVIDFGIAKATSDRRLTDDSIFTALEQFIGTPAYMSPEQAMMTGLDIDTRTDIYSLGVLLYELLTGTPPFDPEDLMKLGVDEMRRTIREDEPERPSTLVSLKLAAHRSARSDGTRAFRGFPPNEEDSPRQFFRSKELVSELRGDLDSIVMKCLEKDRARRYETANGLAADIRRHLANEPVIARPPSATYRLQKAFRRNKLVFSAGLAVAAAVLLTLAALASSTMRIAHEQRTTREALLARTKALEGERVDSYFHRITLAHRELSMENLGGALRFLDDCPEDLRGWEWDYLNRLGRVGGTVLQDTGPVHSVAFHPNGQQIAAACRDGSVKIWDLPTRKVIQTFSGHTSFAFCVAFRPPDGRYLASAGADKKIRVWDTITGGEVFNRNGPDGEYNGMSYVLGFSPDGRQLMADRGDGTLATWNADHGAEVATLPEKHERAAMCVDWSPNGKLLATGSAGGVLRIWDARTSELLHVAREHTHRVSALSFGSNGRSLATASFDRQLKIWDTETGKMLRSWTAHIGIIPGLSFSPEGKRLASSGGEDKVVKIWDPMTGREILNLRGHASTCYCVAFSPDGRQLASSGGDGTIRIWDATPTKPSEAMESAICKHDGEVWSVQFSPDGHLLASGSWDNTVRVWEARTGANLHTFTLPRPGSVFCVAFSPDSRQLAAATLSAGNKPGVMTLDLETGTELLLPQKSLLFCVLFDRSGRFILREGPDFSIHVRDVLNHREVGMLGQHGHNIWGMTFSGDGQSLATASSDGRLKVWAWDPARVGQPREPVLDLPIRVFGYGERVAFSVDGERLFAGGEENTVKMWDSKTGQELLTMRGHSGEVWAIAVDPQGRWLASAGEDSTIRIWDAKSFKLLLTLRGHRGVIMSLAFSPDGERLASGSRDRTVRLWETARWGGTRTIR